MKPDRIGLRYPVEIGLVGERQGDARGANSAASASIKPVVSEEAQSRTVDWNWLLAEVELTPRTPLRPQMLIEGVSDRLSDDAVISLDCGADTDFAARMMLRPNQD